jgi:hypothetical protein
MNPKTYDDQLKQQAQAQGSQKDTQYLGWPLNMSQKVLSPTEEAIKAVVSLQNKYSACYSQLLRQAESYHEKSKQIEEILKELKDSL